MEKIIINNNQNFIKFSDSPNLEYEITFEKNIYQLNFKFAGSIRFGQAFFKLLINNKKIKGYVLDSKLLFIENYQYMICNWMEKFYDIKTIILNLNSGERFVLSDYWTNYELRNNDIYFTNNHIQNIYNRNELLKKLKNK